MFPRLVSRSFIRLNSSNLQSSFPNLPFQKKNLVTFRSIGSLVQAPPLYSLHPCSQKCAWGIRWFSESESNDKINILIENSIQTAQKGDAEKAVQLLEDEVFQKNSRDSRLLDHLSQVYLAKNDFEKCRNVCLMIEEPTASVLSRIGETFEREGQISSAVEYYQKALAKDPFHPMTCFRWGQIAFEQSSKQKTKETKEAYKKLAEDLLSLPLSQNPNTELKEHLLYAHCQVLYSRKEYEKVIKNLTPHVKQNSVPHFSLMLGDCRRNLKKYGDAIGCYETFLMGYPDHVRAQAKIGIFPPTPDTPDRVMGSVFVKNAFCMYSEARYLECHEILDFLIKADKVFVAESYCIKAMCYEKESKWEQVIESATKCIKLNATFFEPFQVRAKAYDMVSLPELAEHDRRRYQYLERSALAVLEPPEE